MGIASISEKNERQDSSSIDRLVLDGNLQLFQKRLKIGAQHPRLFRSPGDIPVIPLQSVDHEGLFYRFDRPFPDLPFALLQFIQALGNWGNRLPSC